MSRALVVVNPTAGGGRSGRAWPGVRDALRRAGLDFDWVATGARGDGARLARDGVRSGHGLIVAVGGDGTLNEVANGITAEDGLPLATMGAVLTGRGRDACRNFGVPAGVTEAAAAVVSGHEAAFDLGVAAWGAGDRRYFLGAAGAGFDAAVATRAASINGGGTLAYLLAVLSTVHAARPMTARIAVDGAPMWQTAVTAVIVANGRYFGGGMKIAPHAETADGLLDLVVLGALGRLEMLRWLPTIYTGGHLANPRVVTRRASAVVIEAPVPLPTEVDGEVVGTTPVGITVARRALRLRVLPAG